MFLKTVFVSCMVACAVFADTSTPGKNSLSDSLKSALAATKTNDSRIDLLTQLGSALARSNPQLSLSYADSARWLARSTKDTVREHAALISAAEALYYSGKPDSAQIVLQKAIDFFESSANAQYLGHANYNLASFYYRQKQNQKAAEMYIKAASAFNKAEMPLWLGRSRNNAGLSFWNLGDYENALKYYKLAYLTFSKLKNSYWMGLVSNNIGTIYWGIGSYNLALKQFHQALDMRKRNKDFHGLVLTLNNIGLIYQEWNKFENALTYHSRALALSDSINDLFGKAYSQINLGTYYTKMNKHDTAIKYFKEAKKNYARDNMNIGQSLALFHLGQTYFSQKKYQEADRYFSSSLQIAEESKNNFRKAMALGSIAETQLYLGNLKKATTDALNSLSIAEHEDYRQLFSKNYFTLSKINERKGNWQQALGLYKKATAWKDSLFNDEKIAEFSDLQVRFRLQDSDRENLLLRKDNEIQRISLESGQELRNYLIIIILLAIATIVLIFLKFRFSKKTNTLLQAQNSKILLINSEKENLINELQSVLDNVKTLEGLLPICSSCKKIRNDEGHWAEVENYVRDHSKVQFSHGLCPDCAANYKELLG